MKEDADVMHRSSGLESPIVIENKQLPLCELSIQLQSRDTRTALGCIRLRYLIYKFICFARDPSPSLEFLPPATKLRQGTVFTPACHSVNGGMLQDTPLGRHPRPRAVHAGRYGQQAGSKHPTGMHTC